MLDVPYAYIRGTHNSRHNGPEPDQLKQRDMHAFLEFP